MGKKNEEIFLWLILALFANFKCQNRTKRLQKTKIVFYKCVVEFHFTYFSGPCGSILSRKAKPLYPTVRVHSKVKKI
jgi:hypothetical protein